MINFFDVDGLNEPELRRQIAASPAAQGMSAAEIDAAAYALFGLYEQAADQQLLISGLQGMNIGVMPDAGAERMQAAFDQMKPMIEQISALESKYDLPKRV